MRRQQAFKRGRPAGAYLRWVLCTKGYRLLLKTFVFRWARLTLFSGAGVCWFCLSQISRDSDAAAYAILPA